MWIKKALCVVSLIMFVGMLYSDEAFARAGGGKSSSGSRGSRTYSAPAKPANPSSPSQIQRQQQPVPASPATPAQPSRMSGFMGMLAGGLIGGMLGSLLFSSLGFGQGLGAGGWAGPGLLDIILIGLIIFVIYKMVVSAKKKSETPAYQGAYQYSPTSTASTGYDVSPSYEAMQTLQDDISKGIGYIRQFDPAFDEKSFKNTATDIFFKIQASWTARDLSPVQDLIANELYTEMRSQIDELRAKRQINRLENIAIRDVIITEAWQEEGKDFITVEFTASVLDYVTDEAGRVIDGSNTEPVKFIEYWTFVRPIGPNKWKLTAIQQPEH